MSKNQNSNNQNNEVTAGKNAENCSITEGCRTSSCKKTFAIVVIIALALLAIFFAVKHNKKTAENDKVSTIDRNASVKTAGDVEEVVAQWIANNPELILESVVNMQKKQAQKQVEDSGANISKQSEELYGRKEDPVHNANNYDVSVVEFFDYNCGYCKRAVATIEELVSKDKKVRIIFKELPILGQSSEDLSKVSLAFNIANPSKYLEFHAALMKSSARTTEDAIRISETHGVSGNKIKAIMIKFKAKIDEEIDNNRKLAQSIGVNGTPAFLVETSLFPGAVDYQTIEQAINEHRKK